MVNSQASSNSASAPYISSAAGSSFVDTEIVEAPEIDDSSESALYPTLALEAKPPASVDAEAVAGFIPCSWLLVDEVTIVSEIV
jgi:hypothetical protein